MRSAIYEGVLTHRRHSPVPHRFTQRLAMPLLFLDEIDEVMALHPCYSAERPNLASFRRREYLPDPPGVERPLDAAVRTLVAERLGEEPTGPIALLAHLRTFGWLFNPIAIYFCYAPDGERIDAIVAEVSNTPWHERTTYVLAGLGEHRFDKALHVSPFFSMDQRYRATFRAPGAHLSVRFANEEAGATVFDATLALTRREMSRSALTRLLVRYPALTARVSAGIYLNAARLWRKGVPFVPHPDSVSSVGTPVGVPGSGSADA